MTRQAWTIAVAALLIGGVAVAVASNVQGQEFEHRAALTESGAAYEVAWPHEEAGTLRLQLAPVDNASAPSATVSLFDEDRELLGTHELTEAWPQVDRIVRDQARYTLIVHEALDATIDVLSQEDRPIKLQPADMDRDQIVLLDGVEEDVAYRATTEVDEHLAHVGLLFEGQATDLSVHLLDDAGDEILSGQVPNLQSTMDQQLAAVLDPGQLDTGTLEVRLTAASLNGTLTLELVAFPEEVQQIFQPRDEQRTEEEPREADEAPNNASEGNVSEEREEHASDRNTTEASEQAPIQGVEAFTLQPDEPVAFTVPDGVERVYLITKEDCAYATLYAPDDAVLASQVIETDEGAMTWDEEERTAAVELTLDGPGEHVVLLTHTSNEGTLFVPGIENAAAVDHRVLEVESHEVELGDEGVGLFGDEDDNATASAEVELATGLMGFAWRTDDGVHLDTEIRLTGPGNETLYEDSRTGTYGLSTSHDEHGAGGHGPVVSGAGTYTVTLEDGSLTGGSVTAELLHYLR